MSLPTLLIRLSDPQLSDMIHSSTELSNFNVTLSSHTDDWITLLEDKQPDVALIEVTQLNHDDYQRLRTQDLFDSMELILISSGDPHDNIDALPHLGAVFHYRKPVNVSVLNETLCEISQFYQQSQTKGEAITTSDLDQFGLLLGSSSQMHELYRTLRRVARTEANVLIVGESGSGKELVAQTIHLASNRKQQPYVAINCGAISPELVDSELFGHVKGAFTGANKPHDGVFKQAQGGTLFLDEVTEMPIEHQVKLLRVLETGEYRPVGDSKVHIANVRVIAATNRDPKEAIEQQLFREDLYFRLSHFPIHVPPLRERGNDIVGLAKHFIAHRNANENQVKTILDSALDKIAASQWPGNVRELKHTIERAFILADDVIGEEHLVFDAPPLETGSPIENLVPAGVALETLEKAAILNTLEETEGNKTESANKLGISVKTLYNKLEKYQDE